MVENRGSSFKVLLENIGANCWGSECHKESGSFAQRLAAAKRTDGLITQSAETELSAIVDQAHTNLQER